MNFLQQVLLLLHFSSWPQSMAEEAEAARIAQAVASLALGAGSDDDAARIASAAAAAAGATEPLEQLKVCVCGVIMLWLVMAAGGNTMRKKMTMIEDGG